MRELQTERNTGESHLSGKGTMDPSKAAVHGSQYSRTGLDSRSGPVRSCIGCRGRAAQDELMRIKRVILQQQNGRSQQDGTEECAEGTSFLVDFLQVDSKGNFSDAVHGHSWRRKRFSLEKGRSVYLHPRSECIQAASHQKRLKAAFRGAVSQKECERFVQQCEELLSAVQGRGREESGHESGHSANRKSLVGVRLYE